MAQKKEKNRNKGDELTLEMTPMIDVVFQLLIFFIVTLKQDDMLSTLEALRPAPDSNSSTPSLNEPTTIGIGKPLQNTPYFFTFNGKRCTEEMLQGYLRQQAKNSKDTMILVNVTGDAPHGILVRCLDLMKEAGLNQVSIMSLDNPVKKTGWPGTSTIK